MRDVRKHATCRRSVFPPLSPLLDGMWRWPSVRSLCAQRFHASVSNVARLSFTPWLDIAGTTQWLATNLGPGTYVLTCLWVDRENDYRLHAFEGELTVLTVGDGGTPVP